VVSNAYCFRNADSRMTQMVAPAGHTQWKQVEANGLNIVETGERKAAE
jgi:hypothetical protein